MATAEAEVGLPTVPQWVVFSAAGRELGLPLTGVREILTPCMFTRLPGAGEEVCGLLGLRGRIVTAFDLGLALGGNTSRAGDYRVLVVEHRGGLAALAVNEVLSVRSDEGTFVVLDAGRLLDRLLG